MAVVDPAGDLLLLGDHRAEPLDAPGVGLVEIDLGAQEGARGQQVGVAAHRVGLRGVRDQGGQLLGEREIAVGRGARSLGDPGALGVVPLGLRGELGEEAVLRGEAAGLLRAEQELAASRDHAVVRRLSERLRPAGQGSGHRV